MPVITHQEKDFTFPVDALGGTSEAPRLKPADELLLRWLDEQPAAPLAIYHDRAGVLSTCCYAKDRHFVADNIRHREAAVTQLLQHTFPDRQLPVLVSPLAPLASDRELILLQVPKATDLFSLYLAGIAATAGPRRRVAAAFQTRHFTPKLLDIASTYAGSVRQSRAYKKARLLLLDDLRPGKIPEELFHQHLFNGRTYYQYYGVFSAHHIDYATRFLLDCWAHQPLLRDLPPPQRLLDIGCGCGIIIDQLALRYPAAELFATDVSLLAINSTRQNNPHVQAHHTAGLDFVASGSIDLIVTNPPFHDGHRNTIGPTLKLFLAARDKLATTGHFVVVANRHLNYATHLQRIFPAVTTVATNPKYVVYCCSMKPAV